MSSSTRPTLSSAETAVLAWADREEPTRVTVRDLTTLVGNGRARQVAASLAGKGLLERLSPGIYRVLPFRAIGTRRTGSGIVAAALVLAGQPYYLGGRTAANVHRLTTQRYSTVVDAYVTHRRRNRPLAAARLVFHLTRPELLSFGIERITVDAVPVMVSDPERTVLDLLDRPERLLGFETSRGILHDSLSRLRVDQLVAYACRWPNASTARRLGVLLERDGISPATLQPLAAHVRPLRGDAVLVPGGPRRGPFHPTFRVILNDAEEGRR